MAFLNISRNKFLYPDTLFVILIKCLKCNFLHEFYTLELCIGKLNTIFSVGVVGLSSKNIEPIIVYLLTNIWKLAICSQQIKTWNMFFLKLALTRMFIYPVTVFFSAYNHQSETFPKLFIKKFFPHKINSSRIFFSYVQQIFLHLFYYISIFFKPRHENYTKQCLSQH